MELLRIEAAVAAPASAVLGDFDGLEDELVGRALAVVGRAEHLGPRTVLPGPAMRLLDDCELRARRLSTGLLETGALDFLGDALALLAAHELLPAGCARSAVLRVADELGMVSAPAALVVYRRAISSRHCLGLPPDVASTAILSLLVALGPAESVSLWVIGQSGKTSCLAAAGRSPRSRRLRQTAQGALDGILGTSSRFPAVVVERWDRPHAALVACNLPGEGSESRRYLEEAAAALSPLLERAAIFERNEASERVIVAAGERRLARLGCDLHDGPLQEIVALAEDLRHAHAQIASLVGEADRPRISGRFDDLEARLSGLDRGLREIAHAGRATTALLRPLDESLRGELAALARATGIDTNLSVDADLGGLTDSQRIVVFRVVQEALANVRKHSGARCVSVRVSSNERLLTVAVSDDGRGFDLAELSESDRLGLAGVSERVRLLGGDIEIESRPGLGTMVKATLARWRPPQTHSHSIYAVTA